MPIAGSGALELWAGGLGWCWEIFPRDRDEASMRRRRRELRGCFDGSNLSWTYIFLHRPARPNSSLVCSVLVLKKAQYLVELIPLSFDGQFSSHDVDL